MGQGVKVRLRVLVAWIVTGLVLAPAARALIPTEGQVLDNGTSVKAPCLAADKKIDNEAKSWLLFTYEPKRIHGGAGLRLAPAKLPEVETLKTDPKDLSGPSIQGAGIPQDNSGVCEADAVGEDTTVSGEEVELTRAGPYTIEQLDSTTHWVAVAPGSPAIKPVACPQNSPLYPGPQPLNPPNTPEIKYEIEKFCNIITLTHFGVAAATGGCPTSGDGSQFPTDPYLNQYDAGALDKLPSAFGEAGGSACGPSSLLMTLAKVLPAEALPDLSAMFDKTMARTAAQAPSGENVFSGANKAVPYLRSIGFKEAKALPLGEDMISVLAGNEIAIDHALHSGPVVISTAFGTTPWGLTGGGHMIVIESRTNTNYLVDDPAGNFFSDPPNTTGRASAATRCFTRRAG
ncbi:MAG TPA: hypothetical protein VGI76_07250 [Solirubrobacteraceae bacterium]|jgi:hypothetical protein